MFGNSLKNHNNRAKEMPTLIFKAALKKHPKPFSYAAYFAMSTYGLLRMATANTLERILLRIMFNVAILLFPP